MFEFTAEDISSISLKQGKPKRVEVMLKSGDIYVFTNENANRVWTKFSKQFEGDHM